MIASRGDGLVSKFAAVDTSLWSRMPTEGLYPLRAWFAETLGGDFSPHELTICPGSQSALAASFRALANAGDPVLMESPTYLGAIAAAVAAGLRPVPVPIDRDGVRPELLALQQVHRRNHVMAGTDDPRFPARRCRRPSAWRPIPDPQACARNG